MAALVLTAVICGATVLPQGVGTEHTALNAVATGKDGNNTA